MIGTTVGHYRILDRLGEGGMGVVYRAEDIRDIKPAKLYALAPLDYGRALAKLGKIDDSRKAYEQFFEHFKNADTTLPVLAAAKKELARLKPPS